MSMAGADESEAALRRRLAWGCRRGMLELDVILSVLAKRLESMPSDDLAAVSELLEKGDDVLYELLVLRSRKPEKELRAVVGQCRNGFIPVH